MRLLAPTAILLLGIAAAETLSGQPDGVPNGAESRRSGMETAGPLPSADGYDAWRDQAVNDLLARPLFAPDRKPVKAEAAAVTGLPRLAGIIAFPGEAMAIFQPSESAGSLVARGGETIGGWEVASVSQDGVTLSKASDRIVLRPAFADIGSRTGTTPAAMPISARESKAGRPVTARLDGLGGPNAGAAELTRAAHR